MYGASERHSEVAETVTVRGEGGVVDDVVVDEEVVVVVDEEVVVVVVLGSVVVDVVEVPGSMVVVVVLGSVVVEVVVEVVVVGGAVVVVGGAVVVVGGAVVVEVVVEVVVVGGAVVVVGGAVVVVGGAVVVVGGVVVVVGGAVVVEVDDSEGLEVVEDDDSDGLEVVDDDSVTHVTDGSLEVSVEGDDPSSQDTVSSGVVDVSGADELGEPEPVSGESEPSESLLDAETDEYEDELRSVALASAMASGAIRRVADRAMAPAAARRLCRPTVSRVRTMFSPFHLRLLTRQTLPPWLRRARWARGSPRGRNENPNQHPE